MTVDYPRAEPFNFLGVGGEEHSYREAAIAVLPIPYEATTSYMAGTRDGPREIINASRHLESYDEEIEGDVSRLGIHTLPEIETLTTSPADMVDRIHQVARSVLDDGKFLVALGGEHTITPPLVKAIVEKNPKLSVLQIDAHGDLRDTYQGSKYSHACAMRRVLEMASGVQVGLRSISGEELEALPSLPTKAFFAHQIQRTPHWQKEVVEALGDLVYVTIDLDGLDPSIMPAVGTPEPGGLGWYETCDLLKRVAENRTIVGFDVNELAPLPGQGAPNFLAAKLVYKFLSYIFKEKLK